MVFWFLTVLIAVATAVYVLRPLAIGRMAARSRAAHDAQVFRDQLLEVDRDLERGVLSAEEARSAKIEISRRLLAADAESRATADHQPAPKMVSWGLAAALVVAMPALGLWIYGGIGAPGLPDQPAAARAAGQRPGQEMAEARLARPAPTPPAGAADIVARVERLEAETAVANPDPQALFTLAGHYGQLGRFGEAWRAYQRLIDLRDVEPPVSILVAKAEAMVIATSGYVSPEAEAALDSALRREPDNPIARYYRGALLAQLGNPRGAIETWASLLADSTADAPWVEATVAQMEDTAERNNLPMPEISAAPPPTAEQTQDMMLGLVDNLARRVFEEGGTVEDWAQVVRSYRTLGEEDRAERILEAALSAFGENLEARTAFEAALSDEPDAAPHGGEIGDLRDTVARLEARLESEGGNAGSWLRLVTSWEALGEPGRAAEAMDRARTALADRPDQLAALDGARGAAPDGLRGPTAEDMAAAADLDEETRTEMVAGMVAGLRERLFEDGGSVEDWARLIRVLGVVGDTDAATEAFDRAREANQRDSMALAYLTETALLAGVTVE